MSVSTNEPDAESVAVNRSAVVLGKIKEREASRELADFFHDCKITPLTWSERIDAIIADIGSESPQFDGWCCCTANIVMLAARIADWEYHDGPPWRDCAVGLLQSLLCFDRNSETFAKIHAELYRMANQADVAELAMFRYMADE